MAIEGKERPEMETVDLNKETPVVLPPPPANNGTEKANGSGSGSTSGSSNGNGFVPLVTVVGFHHAR
jgi:hypothetical protein